MSVATLTEPVTAECSMVAGQDCFRGPYSPEGYSECGSTWNSYSPVSSYACNMEEFCKVLSVPCANVALPSCPVAPCRNSAARTPTSPCPRRTKNTLSPAQLPGCRGRRRTIRSTSQTATLATQDTHHSPTAPLPPQRREGSPWTGRAPLA